MHRPTGTLFCHQSYTRSLKMRKSHFSAMFFCYNIKLRRPTICTNTLSLWTLYLPKILSTRLQNLGHDANVDEGPIRAYFGVVKYGILSTSPKSSIRNRLKQTSTKVTETAFSAIQHRLLCWNWNWSQVI